MFKPDPERDERLKLPEALRDALANSSNYRVLVPPQRDETVLTLAKAQLKSRNLTARRARWGWWVAAAALLAALLVWSSFWTAGKQRTVTSASVGQKSGDVDGNGVVDIFDAFALARQVKQKPSPSAWDINRDGLVDARDITAIAQRAVQLQGRAR